MKTYKSIVTTLFESHYEYGVGALLNSLHISGFQGLFCIGYKGSLPFWTDQLNKTEEHNIFSFTESIDLRFDQLDIGMHFGYYKPYYLRDMAIAYPVSESFYYFDPDIIVIAKWVFFENWIRSGVALCQDSNYTLLHWNHPWRNQWRKDFKEWYKGSIRCLDNYINSGFIGVNREHFSVINSWIEINEKYKELGYPIHYFDKLDGSKPYKGDQDLLNAVLTINPDIKVSIIGKEAMGFDYPLSIMIHAINSIKPWKTKYLKNAFVGVPVTIVDKLFLEYSISPIQLFSSIKLTKLRLFLTFWKLANRIWKK